MLRIISICLLLAIATATHSQKTYWSPEQTMKMKNISTVRISPDGKKAVYAVREAVMTPSRSEYVNQLYVTDISKPDSALRLTHGDRDNSNPRWSPDGKRIGFISNRDGKNNLYILPVAGGESERITDAATGVADFKWAPDSKAIGYTMSDSISPAEKVKETGKEDWYFMDKSYRQGRIYVVWINEKDTAGRQKMLQVTKENRHISSFNWSPDGKWIVYTHALSPIVNDNVYSDIAMVNVSTGEMKNVANTSTEESNPAFSPDGKFIAYQSADDSSTWGGSMFIKVVPATGGKPVVLAKTPSDQPSLLGWSSDGKWVYALEPSHTTNKLFRLSADGKSAVEWSTGIKDMIGSVDLNSRATHFGMVLQSTAMPGDAYASSTTSPQPVRLSRINANIADYPVPKTEVIKWKSVDGKEIEGLLTYPMNYEQGKKYPLILNIHGGPAGVFNQSFIAGNSGVYPIAAFAENGIFVLRPNPRGSAGYGVDFRLANQRDWGGNDFKDLMAGVDEVIAKGLADSSKLAVMGWSYGGFMTSWVVGHTNRFKAASIGAPVVDLVVQNTTDDIAGFLVSYMKGEPWDNWQLYNEHSPLRYVQHVNTPVLLQHGDADIRVPFHQGVMYYHALKRRGVPVKFLVLPRQPHGPVEPKMVLKTNQTNLQWMLHYLMGKPLEF